MSALRMAAYGSLSCAILFPLVLISSCGEARASASALDPPVEPPVIAQLSSEPVLEVGRVEGNADYLLHNAVSSVRLADDRVVILNAGSHQLRFYDEKGQHQRSVGTKGDGPGEFRRPVKLYLPHRDTMVVLDAGNSMEAVFDTAGRLARATPFLPDAKERFPREVWLHHRAYVDGPVHTGGRERVRDLLDRLPSLAGTRYYRDVKVDTYGRIWVRRAPADSGRAYEWKVYSMDGGPIARIATPAGFEIQYIGPDFILGRALDKLNVEHIRLYSVTGMPTANASVHRSTTGGSADKLSNDAAPELRRMRFVLRSLMTQQEIFYSQPKNGYRYANRADQLEWPDDMQGLIVHILEAGPSGWSALLFHETEPVSCGLGVGFSVPIGWKPGVVVCTWTHAESMDSQ